MEFRFQVLGGFLLLSLVAADIPVYGKGGGHASVIVDSFGGGIRPVGLGGNVVSDIGGGLYRAPPIHPVRPIYDDELIVGGGIHGGGFGKGVVGPFGSSKGHVYGLFPHEYVTGISSAYLVNSDLFLPGLYGDGIPHPPAVLHGGYGNGGGHLGVHRGGVIIGDRYGPPHAGFGGGVLVGGGHGGGIISGPAISVGKGGFGGHGLGHIGHVGKGAIVSGGPALSHAVSFGNGPIGPVGKGAIIGGPVVGNGAFIGGGPGVIGGHINTISVIDAPGEVLIGGPTIGSGLGSITGAYGVPH